MPPNNDRLNTMRAKGGWIKTFDLNMPDNNLTPVVKNVDVKKVADATTKLIDKISKMFTKK